MITVTMATTIKHRDGGGGDSDARRDGFYRSRGRVNSLKTESFYVLLISSVVRACVRVRRTNLAAGGATQMIGRTPTQQVRE